MEANHIKNRRNYSLLLLDIDGTLVKSKFAVSKSVEIGLLDIKKNLNVAFVSGRSEKTVLWYVNRYKLDTLQIVEGGSRIISVKGENKWARYLGQSTVLRVIKLINSLNIKFNICQKGVTVKYEHLQRFPRVRLDNVTRISALALDALNTELLENKLKRIAEISFYKVNYGVNTKLVNIDITHREANKKTAVQEMCNILDISSKKVIGVGDSFNDIPFFQSVGYKIAMGNAIPELKTKADYIAPPVFKDGLLEVFSLIKNKLNK